MTKFLKWLMTFTPSQVESIGRYLDMLNISCGVIVERIYRENGCVTFEMVVYGMMFVVPLSFGIRCHRGSEKKEGA